MKALTRPVSTAADKQDSHLLDQGGYVLIIGMLALCLLSLFGIWALNTSDFEIKTASNQQSIESDLNIADGAAKQVGTEVGYAGTDPTYVFFEITDPDTPDQLLVPSTMNPSNVDPKDSQTWPTQYLIPSSNTDSYAYLVTYLNPDATPKGYNAANFSSYKFRIDAQQKTVVEIGGIKIGVKAD